MKLWTVLGTVLLGCLAAEARADHGMPSEARLAEMGLSGMEVLSDAEAAEVCVSGRPPNRWGDLYPFVYGLSRLDAEPPQSRPVFARGLW